MAVPIVEGYVHRSDAAGTSTTIVDVSTLGIQEGDLLIAGSGPYVAGLAISCTGWTAFNYFQENTAVNRIYTSWCSASAGSHFLYKFATAADELVSSFSFSHGWSTQRVFIIRISGVDQDGWLNAYADNPAISGNYCDITSAGAITTTVNDCLLLYMSVADNMVALTPPTGTTLLNSFVGVFSDMQTAIAYENFETAGTTTNRVWDWGATSIPVGAAVFAFKGLAGGGATVTLSSPTATATGTTTATVGCTVTYT